MGPYSTVTAPRENIQHASVQSRSCTVPIIGRFSVDDLFRESIGDLVLAGSEEPVEVRPAE